MMTAPADFDFTRYLAAKKSVDDRALNHGVYTAVLRELFAANYRRPLRVLEIGAGIGTMIERLIVRGAIIDTVYTAVDAEPELMEQADKGLKRYAERLSLPVEKKSSGLSILFGDGKRLAVKLITADVHDFIAQERGRRRWDLLVAHAFLDLVDIRTLLPEIFTLLEPDGLFYFTLNFDGLTVLDPVIDPELDKKILDLYHQSMDRRMVKGKPSGHSQTGRRLFEAISAAQAHVIEAGASDCIVFARQGAYPHDEAYFLQCILAMIRDELRDSPELDPQQLDGWVTKRLRQIDAGELRYMAHGLDFVGRVGTPRS